MYNSFSEIKAAYIPKPGNTLTVRTIPGLRRPVSLLHILPGSENVEQEPI